MIVKKFLAVTAIALLFNHAFANAVVVNQGLSEQEVLAAQQGWCNALVSISKAHEDKASCRKKPC